jgi:hypothetical protein
MKLKVGDVVKVDGDVRNCSFTISQINYKRNKAWVKSTYHRYAWEAADNSVSIELSRLVLASTIPGCVEYAVDKKDGE